MPVYRLTEALVFPPPEGASPEGIVAVGGDYRPERLLLGYAQGIFPWPSEGMPPLWFSPDPRFVLSLDAVHVSRSLRKRIRHSPYDVRADTAFSDVIHACAEVPRPGQEGTWITQELCHGYETLHELGYAHSIEAWREGTLVGGLYGVALGGVFFGESMFALTPDASKVATVTLLGQLCAWGYDLVDCQVYTEHLARFGAEDWSRTAFLNALRLSLTRDSVARRWQLSVTPAEALDLVLE